MSLALADAKTYVARILGGAGDTAVLALAADAMAQAAEEFMHRNNWRFLLQDTAQTFTVAACDTDDNVVNITTATANGFKDVLVGMTVTGTGVTAAATVAVVNSTTSIDLSAATSGGGASVTCTFGGTIPIIQGTDTYKLPAKFWKPLDCRLISAVTYPLAYMQHQNYDALTLDQTQQRAVRAYTIYNGADFLASGTQQTNIKFFGVPNQADVALLKYYRFLDSTADPIDVLDEYQRIFLDVARVFLLETKDATSQRLPLLEQRVEQRLQRAIASDRNEGGEDQVDYLMTPNEFGSGGEPDGTFYPYGDHGGGW